MSDTMACLTLTDPKNFHIWKMRITGKLCQEQVCEIVSTELSSGAPDASTAHSES